ncbi:hypothetical protein [Kineococcus radiotolerans]|uniref:UspA domain protein n=1 Tax=Kineococcus radiotolerans (strain ATCC BAA-149 / DSM 14245 / SRS30216) TaxID=266940 RepID=A6W8D7_KINRD|nr:hypothetical protein [Kineococcus radiotolerans]ABS03076.1 conserved hypothetical protein [Kineococcus radiotolerans SRS30216 = ATCC BAA-149]
MDPSAPVDSWTVVVLTEEAFGDVDARNVAGLHADARAAGAEVRHLVLVPVETGRSLLAGVLDHLSLGEVRAALDEVRHGHPDPSRARAEAEAALAATLAALRDLGLSAEGRTTEGDPLPAVREALATGADVRELVVVTRPHAVEDTFHTDWASRARDALGVPVLHVYAGTTRLG